MLFALCTLAVFNSCKKDDDNDKNNGNENVTSSIVGTWKGQISEGGFNIIITYVFNANNTFTETVVGMGSGSGTFTKTATEITLSYAPDEDGEVESVVLQYTLNGNTLILSSEEDGAMTFTRQ